MPSGLISNLNVAFEFGFTRAVKVNQSQSLHFIETLLSRKNSTGILPRSNCRILRYSSNQSYKKVMASIVPSREFVVDTSVTSCGNASGFVNPGSVFFIDRSSKICRRGRVTMRNGERESHDVQGCLLFNSNPRSNYSSSLCSRGLGNNLAFSSSCNSDGVVPEVSADGSLNVEQLSNVALSVEENIPSQNILKLLSGACYLPHPAKVKTGGEDAHFICADKQVIGVADGVGGWADVGVNAGIYARELMNNSVKAIREVPDSNVVPLRVLEKAHAATNAMGSSTACIVALKDQELDAINLGDSGFIVVRDGRIIFESPVQQHGFNFCYQLERGTAADLPSSGQVFKISVLPGDVVVMGSDGLFDNLYNKEIASIVRDCVKQGLNPDATAQKVAAIARERALDTKYKSPFSTAAQAAGFSYSGGKLDDLTVIVSYISG